jgi:hypothetical protein
MIKNVAIISVLLIIFTGCQKKIKPLYIWNDYTNTSANYGVKGHESEVLEKHLETLKTIIEDSSQKKQRVAPGIYAEYAQLLFEANKIEKAKKFFLLEKETYPESSIFIDKIMTKLYRETK